MRDKIFPDIQRRFAILGEEKDCGCKGHMWSDAGLIEKNGKKGVRLGIRTDKGILHYVDMPIDDAVSLANKIIEFSNKK